MDDKRHDNDVGRVGTDPLSGNREHKVFYYSRPELNYNV
jgi:hypothetical protein